MKQFNPKKLAIFLLLLFCLGCDSSDDTTVVETESTDDAVAPRAVYFLSNSAGANSVLTYLRDTSGTLSFSADTPTGGSGSGGELESSGNALVLDSASNLLYCVNTGSNSISVFFIQTDGSLLLLDTVNSGGASPVSLAVGFGLVYALNAGDVNTPANVVGFQLIGDQLIELDGATQTLSAANPNPTQIEFYPTGALLTVTESDTDQITHITLDGSLLPVTRVSSASAGPTPQGFDFTAAGILITAESNNGQAGGGAVSSFQVGQNGDTVTVSGSVGNTFSDTCCVLALAAGEFAVVSNPASNNLSVYAVTADGTLTSTGTTANTETGPAELVTSEDELFLYALNRGSDSVSIFDLDATNGTLTPVSTLTGLPSTVAGMAGR